MTSRIDDFGGPNANNHYAVGWAHAMDTPYQWTKQVASHWGGTRNGADRALAVRHRAPRARCAPSSPTSSTSRRPSWRPRTCRTRRSCTGSSRHRSRASACSTPSTTPTPPSGTRRSTSRSSSTAASTTRAGPRSPATRPRGVPSRDLPALDDDVWELYTPDDWTQAHNVAAEQPERLRDLQRLFLHRGRQVQRLPAGRPPLRAVQLRPGRPPAARQGQHPAAVRRHGPAVGEQRDQHQEQVPRRHRRPLRRRRRGRPASSSPRAAASAAGSLYVHDGKPAYCYNLLGVQQFKIYGDTELEPGRPPGADGVRLRRRRPRQGRHRHPLHRRQPGRPGPGRRHPADDLLRRRDHRPRQRLRHPGQRRLRHRAPAPSPAGSAGSRSTSATTPRTPTTSSPPKSATASPSPCSNG